MSKLRECGRTALLLFAVGCSAPALAPVVTAPAPVVSVLPIRPSDDVFPSLRDHLQVHYDFEHPAGDELGRELDQGLSGTDLQLVNGGESMRVAGGVAGGRSALQLAQVAPASAGNDDWKAGVYDAAGVERLSAFSAVKGMTLLTWVEMLGDAPALNSNTAEPEDRYNAIGLVGLLTGDSDGHAVRALLELITVDGTLRLVALGRRLDGGRSQTFAANEDWRRLLPVGEWVHLAASFDFSTATLKLYRNGQPIAGTYRAKDDPWQLAGAADLRSSATLPRGIKIGGSFPQNTREMNPCPCRMDAVMLLDRVATQLEINQQYRRALGARAE
jgi:Concanavalin A-like lectin/glucanases superfamily